MHELSLSLNTVELVVAHARKHRAERVTLVRLAIGQLSCIEPQALQTGFELACRGTLAEGAQLTIESIPARAWCQVCQQQVLLELPLRCCPNCLGYQLNLETGEELMIKEIEVEPYV